jgi:hypothetical protein
VKLTNVEVALRLLKIGEGWKIVVFQQPRNDTTVFRLSHVDGYVEEMIVTDEEMMDDAAGVMTQVRQWLKEKTFTDTFEHPVMQPSDIPFPKPAPKPAAAEPAVPGRTRLITLED